MHAPGCVSSSLISLLLSLCNNCFCFHILWIANCPSLSHNSRIGMDQISYPWSTVRIKLHYSWSVCFLSAGIQTCQLTSQNAVFIYKYLGLCVELRQADWVLNLSLGLSKKTDPGVHCVYLLGWQSVVYSPNIHLLSITWQLSGLPPERTRGSSCAVLHVHVPWNELT